MDKTATPEKVASNEKFGPLLAKHGITFVPGMGLMRRHGTDAKGNTFTNIATVADLLQMFSEVEAAEHARIVKRLRDEAIYACPCADDETLTAELADILLAEGAGGLNL